MKNFDWTRYTKKIAVKASIDEVYAAWTSAEELEKWFLKEVKFYDKNKNLTDKHTSAEKDFTYEWRWHLYDDVMAGEILQANGKNFLQFTFEGETIVEIRLTTVQGYTLIELTHKNIPTDDNSKQHIRLGCASGWTFYLINLKSVYEGGLDLRNMDEQLPTMINN